MTQQPSTPALHEMVGHLRPLLGTWRGQGTGSYPTIETFDYLEEVSFGHVGKPFLAYGQKTRHAKTDLPLHAESGYIRAVADNGLEVVLAHPTGILESLGGSVDAPGSGLLVLDLHSVAVSGTATAVEVKETTRRIEIDGDTLTYDISMAAAGQPLTHHLRAELTRVVD